jgi:hypothetical protein
MTIRIICPECYERYLSELDDIIEEETVLDNFEFDDINAYADHILSEHPNSMRAEWAIHQRAYVEKCNKIVSPIAMSDEDKQEETSEEPTEETDYKN